MLIKRFLPMLCCSLSLMLSAAGSSSARKVEVLLVPALPNHIRVGMDLVEREGVVLMAYALESDPASPFLHVWNGSAWIRVPGDRYVDGSFLRNQPSRLLIVGGDSDLTTTLIEQAVTWSPEVLNLAPENVTDLINGLGRQLNSDGRTGSGLRMHMISSCRISAVRCSRKAGMTGTEPVSCRHR